ncbi:MAG TPA: RNA-binding S4 domain-containing protein [Saprospiraceae bacterium]|nr:RNA-binding S4 domain-containing protein [Saprospiraceae bacterium]
MESMRVDKWLWSVRIFKSRTLAADACKSGKIRVPKGIAKPASMVAVGDIIEVKKNGFDLKFKVLSLLKSRVGAPIAMTCYEDHTPAEELNKYKDWFVGKSGVEYRDKGMGRPTKKERREIDDFKDEYFSYDWYDEEEV